MPDVNLLSLPSFFRLSGIGRHAAVGQGGQASDGRLFAQAPIRSRHPTAHVRNDTTHRVDGSRQGQQIHVRHTEGQTQRAVPGTSSLSHGTKAWLRCVRSSIVMRARMSRAGCAAVQPLYLARSFSRPVLSSTYSSLKPQDAHRYLVTRTELKRVAPTVMLLPDP